MGKSKLPPADETIPATDPLPKSDALKGLTQDGKEPKDALPGAPSTDIDALKLDPTLLGSPATGGPVKEPTGTPPQAPVGTSLDALGVGALSKDAILDRLAADHAALLTPEIVKTALRKADEQREHGAPPATVPADTLQADTGPRDIMRDDAGKGDYEPWREVTVKLGAPQEADFLSEGMTVSHVNTASGEVTFRVDEGSKSFNSVRARQVVKR